MFNIEQGKSKDEVVNLPLFLLGYSLLDIGYSPEPAVLLANFINSQHTRDSR